MKRNNTKAKRRPKLPLYKGSKQNLGLPPGTPVHIGETHEFAPYITFYRYNCDELISHDRISAGRLKEMIAPDRVNWIDVEGIHDIPLIKELSDLFDIHPLTQEDVVNTNRRPLFEVFPGYLYLTLKMLYLVNNGTRQIRQEQISLVIKDNVVISFQEIPGDVFDGIRTRLKTSVGRIRSRGADYLTYLILDAIIDSYYQVVDHVGEGVDQLEDDLRIGIKSDQLERIADLKRELVFLRKTILPVRDMINKINVEGAIFGESSLIYQKDLADHILQVSEVLNTYTEVASVLVETYHSQMNQRLNAIMKVLTMISTIFLPLNFIAGIYGMNFKHMPELEWTYSYPIVLVVMLLVALGMVVFFIHKKWLFENR